MFSDARACKKQHASQINLSKCLCSDLFDRRILERDSAHCGAAAWQIQNHLADFVLDFVQPGQHRHRAVDAGKLEKARKDPLEVVKRAQTNVERHGRHQRSGSSQEKTKEHKHSNLHGVASIVGMHIQLKLGRADKERRNAHRKRRHNLAFNLSKKSNKRINKHLAIKALVLAGNARSPATAVRATEDLFKSTNLASTLRSNLITTSSIAFTRERSAQTTAITTSLRA